MADSSVCIRVEVNIPPRPAALRAPSVARLIHLLIEERAACLRLLYGGSRDLHRDRARLEIERDVLSSNPNRGTGRNPERTP